MALILDLDIGGALQRTPIVTLKGSIKATTAESSLSLRAFLRVSEHSHSNRTNKLLVQSLLVDHPIRV